MNYPESSKGLCPKWIPRILHGMTKKITFLPYVLRDYHVFLRISKGRLGAIHFTKLLKTGIDSNHHNNYASVPFFSNNRTIGI